ncbi:hypothetical protein OROMI_007551 [Orobanche minor]
MKSLPDVKTATDLPAQLNNSPSSFLDGFAGEKLPLMKDTTILKIVGSLPSSNSPAVTGDLELPLLGGSLPDIISRGAHTSGKKVEPRGLQRVPLSCANDMKNPFVPPFAVESIHPQLDDDALHLTDKGLQRVPLSRANDVKNPFVPPFAVESLQLDDDALHLTDKGRGIKRQGQVLLATVNEAKGEEEAYRPFKVPRKATRLMNVVH